METDKTAFCRTHYKMMYDYGNRLGSALILSTHMKKMNEDLKADEGVQTGQIFHVCKDEESRQCQDVCPDSLGAMDRTAGGILLCMQSYCRKLSPISGHLKCIRKTRSS